jgi:hypothetical protein
MNAEISGKNTCKVKFVTQEGFSLELNDKEYFLSFADYPYFKQIPAFDIFNVEVDEYKDLRWDKYDIDLCEDIIKEPSKYPLKMKLTASEMGRIGGRSRSFKKRRASKLNGRLGGRPKKQEKTKV